MSFSTLNIAASGLYVAQRAAELAADNVANANTPGYTRQSLAITTSTPTPGTPGLKGDGMRGTGVTVVSIDRLRDELADVAYRQSAGQAGSASARSGVLSRTQEVLGPYSQGAPDQLDAFFSAWDQLSLNPSDPAARSTVISSASSLADSIRQASSSLTAITNDTAGKVSADVTQINNLATQVAKLNQLISEATNAGEAPNDLMDQRDQALDQLSNLTGATVVHRDNGQADVYVGTSILVSGTTTRQLQSTQGQSGTVVSFTDGGSAAPKGEVGGYLQTTNVDIPGFMAQLNAFASGLIQSVNAIQANGYTLNDPSATSPNGGPFFDGTSASNISLHAGLRPQDLAAGATNSPNDGNNAIAMSQLRNLGVFTGGTGAVPSVVAPGSQTSSSGFTLADQLRNIAGILGSAASDATQQDTTTHAALDGANKLRSQENSVSTDSEMVDLVKFQHAYDAAARVMTIADSMLDTLINHLGAGW